MRRLSDDEMRDIVTRSVSFCDACRKAGKKPRGATLQFFTKRIRKIGIDTSHFLGKAAHAGARQTGKCRKQTWEEILVEGHNGREKSSRLRSVFREYSNQRNIPYACSICRQVPIWNQRPLKLQIDHINNNHADNRPENLRWICPNCHTQK